MSISLLLNPFADSKLVIENYPEKLAAFNKLNEEFENISRVGLLPNRY